jgi:hypothetical protein
MAHIGNRYAFLSIDVDLEGKQHQHMRYGLAYLVDAVVAPRPDGRPDEMHGRYSGLPQLQFQLEIEVRGIDADEYRRRLGEHAALYVAVDGK